ncbi:MAG: bifunctional riboflavin kinase/FAD synthetase [Clostridia bacterium]|nr:bifunctional riboflavin kinase/FAD synthetase [Clostridia bacterium]
MENTITKNSNKKRVIAVGNFDGVHLGHAKVLQTAAKLASEQNAISAALTFLPYPKDFFLGEGTVKRITDNNTKTELILKQGISEHITEEFNQKLSDMNADEFTMLLKNKYNCSAIVCGANFKFGKKAAYGAEDMKKACEKQNMKAVVCVYEEGFSSTAVRELILEGKVSEAAQILGRPFELHGTVLHGRHIGTEIGFPTVNLTANENFLLPKFGVYETRVICEDEFFTGITNVGIAPTVSESKNVRIETFLLNTNKNLYGKEIKVEFIKFIRAEKKFTSLEELKTQIKIDLSQIKR